MSDCGRSLLERILGVCCMALMAACTPDAPPKRLRGEALVGVGARAGSVASSLRCPADPWPVYAHDAQRTGVSAGCCKGPLTPLWRFDPPPKPPRTSRLHHAVVSANALYVSGVIGDSPSVFALSLAGKLLWTFDSHVDITRHEWPSFVLDRVVLNDDGLYILDSRKGEQEVNRGLDSWGQVLTNGKNLLATNTWYVAGPRTYVGALEVGGAPLWKHHEYGVVREDVMDRLGGLALAGERLLFAPDYAPSKGAGVYAHASADGAELWRVETVPKSHIAVDGQTVYLFERPEGEALPTLVARDVATGAKRWSFRADPGELTGPIVMQGKVMFRDKGGALVAVRRNEGTEIWHAGLASPDAGDVSWSTSMAGARGSSTVVAVDGKELVVLSAESGQVQWRGRPESIARGSLHSPVAAAGRLFAIDGAGLVALACARP